MELIRSRERSYIGSHPVVFWLCVGLFLAGSISLIAPSTAQESSVSLALPHWLRIAFTACYTLGAGLCIAALARGIAPLEAAGQTLLGVSFLADYAVIVHLRPEAWVSGLFIVALAIGCLSRGHFISKHGYPPRVTE